MIGSKSKVKFKNAADGRDVELEVKGSWLGRSADITLGGQPVAEISRSFFSLKEIFTDKDTVYAKPRKTFCMKGCTDRE